MALIYDSSHSGQEIDAAVDAVQTTIPSQLATIGLKIGDLTELETTDKSDLVSAINEVKNNAKSAASDVSYVDNQGLGSTNVQGALDAVAESLGMKSLESNEAGEYHTGEDLTVAYQYTSEGFDAAKLSKHFVAMVAESMGMGMAEMVEEGFAIAGENLNIAFLVDSRGAHAANILEFENL